MTTLLLELRHTIVEVHCQAHPGGVALRFSCQDDPGCLRVRILDEHGLCVRERLLRRLPGELELALSPDGRYAIEVLRCQERAGEAARAWLAA